MFFSGFFLRFILTAVSGCFSFSVFSVFLFHNLEEVGIERGGGGSIRVNRTLIGECIRIHLADALSWRKWIQVVILRDHRVSGSPVDN